MTTALSPRDLLSAYCNSARAVATAKGRPQPRSAFPGLAIKPTAMVYQRGSKLMFHPMGSSATVLTAELFTEELVTEGSSIVVADQVALTRLITIGEKMPDDDYGTLSRRLRTVRGLARSVKLPLLTEALAYRYWLQDNLDDTVLADWLSAFEVVAPNVSLELRKLIALALDGSTPETLGYPKHVLAMESLEQRILHNVNWSGISTDCHVFQMLENSKTKGDTLRLLDPALLEMHAIDGQVCRISPLNLDEKFFDAAVSVPFKLKEGAETVITDGTNKAIAKLSSLQYGDGVLHAEFGMPSKRGGGLALVFDAYTNGTVLYVLEKSFESFSKAPENKRWLGGVPAPTVSRDVPLDVLMAGRAL